MNTLTQIFLVQVMADVLTDLYPTRRRQVAQGGLRLIGELTRSVQR